MRGTERSSIAWNAEALDQMVDAALLRYLAVAHFGRGRGDWAQGETPPHWKDVIAAELASQRDALTEVWSKRDLKAEREGQVEALATQLQPLLRDIAEGALAKLYPAVTGDRIALASP